MSPVLKSQLFFQSQLENLTKALTFPKPVSTFMMKLGLLLATSLIIFTRNSLSSLYSLLLRSPTWLSGQLVFGNKLRTETTRSHNRREPFPVTLSHHLVYFLYNLYNLIILFSYLSVFQSLIEVSFMNKAILFTALLSFFNTILYRQ